MLLALGANDGLRGLSTDELARNLGQIIERAQARKITVILAGMEAPPNFGAAYVSAFRQVFPQVAKRYGVPLVPFLLDGVAGVSKMNQGDGIHPTAAGARRVADNIWSVLAPVAQAHAIP
jgi:acyl-CoA thioesterase-1